MKIIAALGCWLLAGWMLSLSRPSAYSPLGVCGSPYGGLIAGLIKSSLHTYWHGGSDDHDHAGPPPRSALANRFAQHNDFAASHDPPSATADSWLEKCARGVSEIEERRTKRNSPFALSPMHRRFLEAAAGWRLRLACALDPGDPALYEILHYIIQSSAADPQTAKRRSAELAERAFAQAISAQASPAAALTGAGAMLNLLNDALQPERTATADAAALGHDWDRHRRCLMRYHDLIHQAREQGWWDNAPENRRQELDLHASLIEKLSAEVRQLLLRRGVNARPVAG